MSDNLKIDLNTLKKLFNKVLKVSDRVLLKPIVEEMFSITPDMMSRKIPDANMQQAFVFATIKELATKDDPILCVGMYEDTCYDSLLKLGYNVFGIDRNVNTSLHQYKLNTDKKYKYIFSISTIEHEKEDAEFMQDICDLLFPDGMVILTCDFLATYEETNKPHFAERLYTEYDLRDRLGVMIEELHCKLIGEPNWKGKPNFEYQGYKYNFATMVFKKDK